MSGSAERRQRLLRIKRRIAAKRPRFVQVESWRYVRIPPNWRRPRGLDDKVRRSIKGWPASPKAGYGSPREVRGLHPSELEEVPVYNVGDLAIINPEAQAARIGGTVGERKRVAIVQEALKRNIRVLNLGKTRPIAELEEAEGEEEEAADEAGEGAEAEGGEETEET